ncbi:MULTISPECIES: FeoB-associated Cys-rich membrane protein [Erysipelotrichales]
MIDWLLNHISTLFISIVLLMIIIWIIRYMINEKRQGKSSCGGQCGHCQMNHSCNHSS